MPLSPGVQGTAAGSGAHPRNVLDVRGLVLRVEGLKRRKFYAFALENTEGEQLLRLSAPGAAAGKQWVAALAYAGAEIFKPSGGAADAGAAVAAAAAAAGAAGAVHDVVRPTHDGGGLRRSRTSGVVSEPEGGEAPQLSPGGPVASLRRLASTMGRRRPGLSPAAQRRERAIRRRAAFPPHRRTRFSLLSSEQIEVARHSGLLNLFGVIIVATNFRLVIENLRKYGILIKLQVVRLRLEDWPLVVPGAASLALAVLLAYANERALLAGVTSARATLACHVVLVALALLVPALSIQLADSDIVPGFLLMAASVATTMKLISYAHVNYDLRRLAAQKREVASPDGEGCLVGAGDMFDRLYSVAYPANITVGNLLYFMAAPTLCYQPSYPRSRGPVRRSWLARRALEYLLCAGFLMLVIEQYIVPAAENTLKLDVERGIKGLTPARAIERVLKLSLPVLYSWLCVFYGFFHVQLNVMAELLRFGDREFYSDWWNAETLSEYWRKWNLPVHNWATRHVYFPLLEAGVGKTGAMLGVFFLSAALHEVLIGVPCHVLRFWAFGGMMAQAPLVFLTNKLKARFKSSNAGNIIFWLTFCIFGQPMILLLYWHDVALLQRAKEAGGGA